MMKPVNVRKICLEMRNTGMNFILVRRCWLSARLPHLESRVGLTMVLVPGRLIGIFPILVYCQKEYDATNN